MRFWPQSIRLQMLAGLLLLETLSIGLFAGLLIHQETRRIQGHARERLVYEATTLALQSKEALLEDRPAWMGICVRTAGDAPSVALARVTDASGKVLYLSKGDANQAKLEPEEIAEIPLLKRDEVKVFSMSDGRLESASPIFVGVNLRGFAWIQYNQRWAQEQLSAIRSDTLIFGIIWVVASAILVFLMSRAISRPLAVLHRGTRALMTGPQGNRSFPLPVVVKNEFGDLIQAFNRMVASIEEQRSGLNDTLSLLDSMLANAPIGLVFFDRRRRIVRVNGVFARMTERPLSRHLGRTLGELLPEQLAQKMDEIVKRVIATENPVHDVELGGPYEKDKWPSTWLVNAYPVRTTPNKVRWIGVIVIDTSERKRSEEALRRTEKLAATGRLAASIAHEINNPLEAIINLLFLLRNYCTLDSEALNYVNLADHEVRRMSEITQQTLRYYRQATLPARTSLGELLDSILTLYGGRMHSLGIQLERKYNPEIDLFCFAGEVRQVLANLVSNSIDATVGGGRLIVSARRARDWQEPRREGVRFTVADTGIGMEGDVRERLFEAFFTTKGATGTGLGLWVSHEIILKHHATVRVRSRTAINGRMSGTVFLMFFPDNTEPIEQVPEATSLEA
jgi:PAS domain S-box-containing protein